MRVISLGKHLNIWALIEFKLSNLKHFSQLTLFPLLKLDKNKKIIKKKKIENAKKQ
jgi:hypothetical protein